MKNPTIKKDINLPLFPGFYHSRLSGIVDNEEEYTIENHIESGELPEGAKYDDFTEFFSIDYSTMYLELAKDFYSIYKDILGNIKETGLELLDFVKVDNPREYNFTTDDCVVNCKVDTEAMLEYMILERVGFSEYLKRQNTSYDGFFSHYSNDFNVYYGNVAQGVSNVHIEQVLGYYIEKNHNDDDDKYFTGFIDTILDELLINFCFLYNDLERDDGISIIYSKQLNSWRIWDGMNFKSYDCKDFKAKQALSEFKKHFYVLTY